MFVYGDIEKASTFFLAIRLPAAPHLPGLHAAGSKARFPCRITARRPWTSPAPRSSEAYKPGWGKMLAWRNMMWALTDLMAHNPDPWVGDTVLPNTNAGLAYRWFMTVGYPRVKEIIEQDLGSALIYLNSHAADFKNPEHSSLSRQVSSRLQRLRRGQPGQGDEADLGCHRLRIWRSPRAL